MAREMDIHWQVEILKPSADKTPWGAKKKIVYLLNYRRNKTFILVTVGEWSDRHTTSHPVLSPPV